MLRCGTFSLCLDRPLIMGIINVTPDSFSGDGVADNTARAIDHALRQIENGADLIDLGAESSRPGAIHVPLEEELKRLLPVLDALRNCGVPVSVDTYKPEVMRAALQNGASMINDIYALRMPGAIEAVAESNCGICLMHMQGHPLTMQQSPFYRNVVDEVRSFLDDRVKTVTTQGISPERLVIDPGFCFGKTLDHNLELFKRLGKFSQRGQPLLVGISRKSMLGTLTGKPVDQRLAASIAAALIAVERGAKIIRVHDVAETREALLIWEKTRSSTEPHQSVQF